MTDKPLNAGQQLTADGVFNWLLSDQKELCISGPGGVGKTFLMGHLIDKTLPKYFDMCNILGMNQIYQEVNMTATTNKAAEVLGIATGRPTQTIQSLLRLRVYNDYETGKSKLAKNKNWCKIFKRVIFVDESSMIDSSLRRMILETAEDCKIIYVGDHCQLAPVGEKISPIYADNLPFFQLTEPMRNSGQPALMDVCQQLRQTVETGTFNPIRIVPGVIDHMEPSDMEKEVKKLFMDPGNQHRILCYTNEKVMQVNSYIRSMRNMPQELTVGEFVVNNSAIVTSTMTLRVEEEFEIMEISSEETVPIFGDVELKVKYCTLRGKHGTFSRVPVPVDRAHFNNLVKYFKKKENWRFYYSLTENYADLRPRDASTVYKAQGSTYETTLIDLDDISTCPDPSTVARMLYVALSRAKNRIVMYGKLAKKYGGLTR